MSTVERPLAAASLPRPTFDGPSLVRRTDVTRHVWGDPQAGAVFDWIHASTERVHMLVFGLAPGGAFRHSEAYRTVFAADEVLHVLEGTLVMPTPRPASASGRASRSSSAATPGTTRSRTGPSRCASSSCSRPRRPRARRARTPGSSRTSSTAATPTTRTSVLGAGRDRRAAAARRASRRRPVAARPRRPLRDPRQHRAPHRGAGRDRAGRGGPPARARRRRGPDGAPRAAVGARLARRRGPRLRARGRGRLLPPGGLPARVPQRGRGARARDLRDRTIAEARHGPARDFLYISVGSGISHCLVADGRPRAGARGRAINTGARLVEQWSGGLARARRSGHRSAQETLDDPAAAAIVEDGARRLGAVLATLVNALDPGAVVFGGGLASTPATATARSPPCADVYDDAVRDLPARAAFLGAEGAIAGTALAAARAGQAAGSVASLA